MAQDKPAPVFNLDGFKPEGEQKPFPVNFGGKLYNMTHLDQLDGFGTLEAFTQGDAESTRRVLSMSLGDDYDSFKANKPTKGMLDAVVKRYLEHCGVDTAKSDD